MSPKTHPSRRAFLAAGLAAAAAPGADQSTLLDVNYRKLVSRGDLVYSKPAPRSEAGIPVGNGRMGTLVWTTPAQMRLQINRADVYSSDSASNSFNERHNDYCGGCGFIDVELGGYGEDVFPESGFMQRLSIYDGLLAIDGAGVSARVVAWPDKDVIAIEITDRRRVPEPVAVSLRMLRYESKHIGTQLEAFTRQHINMVRTASQTAASQLLTPDDCIALTQEFREGDFYCKSAIVVGIVDRAAKALIANETEARLSAGPGSGVFTILIASAASFDPREDVVAAAQRQLQPAAGKGFAALARETSDWWRHFWSRGFVHLSSADGAADYVEQNYSYFLYLMAATSRGKYPPKFNGMLWSTGGDLRAWGAQHWHANTSCYYEAIPSTNRYELMDPFFDMYFGAHAKCAEAARQQWGSQGIYIPETMYFDGLEKLPDDIAAEMRELYLLRKPWADRSAKFIEYSQHKHAQSSRWNWIAKGEWIDGRYVETERGSGPYGNVSHILGTSAKIPYLFWRRYEYTLDQDWLRNRAYPMLKGAAEFYRNFPNLQKEADGKYHIHHVNSNESIWGARDTDEDLSAMRGVLAAVIRASEILGVDAESRAKWKELLGGLADLPRSDDPDAVKPENYSGPRVYVRGRKPVVKGGALLPDGNSLPAWLFDLCNLESPDRDALEVANNTLTAALRGVPGPNTPVGLLSKLPMAAAQLGRGEQVRYLIPNQMRGLIAQRPGASANLANRMSLREGPQALDAEALGRASEALHLALLQSNPPGPAGDPVIRVFPAWPKGWDAAFTLLARGAFLVSSSIEKDQIGFVELESRAGTTCALRNPWGAAVALYRDGKKSETLTGSMLRFATKKGERIVVVQENSTPAQHKRAILV